MQQRHWEFKPIALSEVGDGSIKVPLLTIGVPAITKTFHRSGESDRLIVIGIADQKVAVQSVDSGL